MAHLVVWKIGEFSGMAYGKFSGIVNLVVLVWLIWWYGSFIGMVHLVVWLIYWYGQFSGMANLVVWLICHTVV